ncbi:YraN family protein [Subtercola sp. YIM 133946]|uniref:YraN family protein n=1 Tax=Subtercola sp. YIM 133946 TaxID=3118909 RepID=UPI002F91FA73
MKAKDELGRRGEQLACDYLSQGGYAVVGRNWRCAQGEIDVIAERGGVTAFVEVKTRSGLRYGHPFEAITVAKLARLKRLSAAWCEACDEGGRPRRIRIDLIGVVAPPGRVASIEHLEGVF